jgi:hypothetical protein
MSLPVWFLDVMEMVSAEDVPILIQNRSQYIFDIQMYLSWNKCSVLHLPRNHSMVQDFLGCVISL